MYPSESPYIDLDQGRVGPGRYGVRMPIIGIDLGTSHSAAAVMRGGRVVDAEYREAAGGNR